MINQSIIPDLKSRIEKAQNILITLPAQLTVDKLAAALALDLTLQKLNKQSFSSNKKVVTVTADTLRVSHTNLYGVGEVKSSVPTPEAGNFIITLSGVVDTSGSEPAVKSLEKLDWYPEGDSLNLVFHVVPGQKFEPTNISSKHQSNGFDLIFVVGASSLNDLGAIYASNPQIFTTAPIVTVDTNAPGNFAALAVTDQNAASISEIIMQLFSALSLSIDEDISSNIIAGVYAATNNLTVNVKPETFMAIGSAMQQGGKLIPVNTAPAEAQLQPQPQTAGFDLSQNQPQQPAAQVAQQPVAPVAPAPVEPVSAPAVEAAPQQAPQSGSEPNPFEQFITPPVAPKAQEEAVSGEVMAPKIETPETPTPDWLVPKIYKGGNLG